MKNDERAQAKRSYELEGIMQYDSGVTVIKIMATNVSGDKRHCSAMHCSRGK